MKGLNLDSIKKKMEEGKNKLAETADTLKEKIVKKEEQTDPFSELFIRLMYDVMILDGTVSEEEMLSFREMGKEIDPDFETYADLLKENVNQSVLDNEKEYGRVNAVKMDAQSALKSFELSNPQKKLILWNLLTIAGSDGITDGEQDLIRYIAEKAELNDTSYRELEMYYHTAEALEEEERKLKESGKSYKEVEPLVNEVNERKLVIVKAVKELIEEGGE